MRSPPESPSVSGDMMRMNVSRCPCTGRNVHPGQGGAVGGPQKRAAGGPGNPGKPRSGNRVAARNETSASGQWQRSCNINNKHELANTRSRIHEHSILLRFLGIIESYQT